MAVDSGDVGAGVVAGAGGDLGGSLPQRCRLGRVIQLLLGDITRLLVEQRRIGGRSSA